MPSLKNLKSKSGFLKTAASDPAKVGAVARTSKYVIRRVLESIPKPLTIVVEYGPGDGAMTKALLKELLEKGKLIAIETNEEFAKVIKKINDPRVRVIHGRAQDAETILKSTPAPDLIVSSIPFSLIPPRDREDIVVTAKKFLAKDGKFIIFHQYTPLMSRIMKKYFREVDTSFEPRNIFPCFVIVGKK